MESFGLLKKSVRNEDSCSQTAIDQSAEMLRYFTTENGLGSYRHIFPAKCLAIVYNDRKLGAAATAETRAVQ
jgi:hypothetical protein